MLSRGAPTNSMADAIDIVVAYAAEPGDELIVGLRVAANATLAEAVEASGILLRHPEINRSVAHLGVWGKTKRADTRVREGDRIEVYRQLLVEPNAARLARAAKRDRLEKAGLPGSRNAERKNAG